MNTVKMYGPAFSKKDSGPDPSGRLVEREVPEADVRAFEEAGYKRGQLPDALKTPEPPEEPEAVEPIGPPSHETAPAESSEDSNLKSGKLPDDFPGRTAFEAAGITTFAKLRALNGDYTSVSGIGDATATKVKGALEA